jgi:hypothetical protein
LPTLQLIFFSGIQVASVCDTLKKPRNKMSEKPVKGRSYYWREIEQLVGHEPCGYLTQVGQNIVYGCFRKNF